MDATHLFAVLLASGALAVAGCGGSGESSDGGGGGQAQPTQSRTTDDASGSADLQRCIDTVKDLSSSSARKLSEKACREAAAQGPERLKEVTRANCQIATLGVPAANRPAACNAG